MSYLDPRFERRRSELDETEKLQDSLERTFGTMEIKPLRYTDVTLTVGFENIFEHGLGRTYIGFRIVNSTQPSMFWEYASTAVTDKTKFLVLGTATTASVTIEVF